MKNIIELLKESIKNKDISFIIKQIESNGFRLRYSGNYKNFDKYKVNGSKMIERLFLEDNNLQRYSFELENNEKYQDIIFINVYKEIFDKRFDIYLPSEVTAYTNAPITEDFVENIPGIATCVKCKTVCRKKRMTYFNDEWYCSNCFFEIMQKAAKQYEKDNPKEFEFLKKPII